MSCELDIIDGLNALGYEGKCSENYTLTRALDDGLQSDEFHEVVTWLTGELHGLNKTDEQVSADVENSRVFAMELSAMLKELGCPYSHFVAGPLSDRFETTDVRMQLLDYLITELMATKMSLRLHPVEQTYIIPKFETKTALAMEQLMCDLGMSKPPSNVAPKALFNKINFKLEDIQRQLKPVLGEPILQLKKPLTDVQWELLEVIQADLDVEYNLRRQMLLTRLEVTVRSFHWSDKMKSLEKGILVHFQRKIYEVEGLKHGGDDTNIIALLAGCTDLAIIEKTSSANVRKNTACKIQKHVIGRVPDRGGRADEHAPPPPEMPSWQQQRSGGGGARLRGDGNNFCSVGGGVVGGADSGNGYWHQFASNQPQRPQFDQGGDQNLLSGSDRVQGSGWTIGNKNYHGGGGSKYHGRSNYNRGGGYRH